MSCSTPWYGLTREAYPAIGTGSSGVILIEASPAFHSDSAARRCNELAIASENAKSLRNRFIGDWPFSTTARNVRRQRPARAVFPNGGPSELIARVRRMNEIKI